MFAPRTPEYYSSFQPSPAGPAPWPDDKNNNNASISNLSGLAPASASNNLNHNNSQSASQNEFHKSASILQASSDAQTEANRRRGLEETYTKPITTTSVKNLTKVTDFMSDFNKFSETYESTFLNHLQEYKSDLQPIYKKLVPAEVTHKAFVQHYFFRCGDLQRIQDDLDEQEKARQKAETKKREEQERLKKQREEDEKRKVEEELAKQQEKQAPPFTHSNSSVRWKGVSTDDPTKRAAWETSEGARISLRATKPPQHVQRQVTMEYNSDSMQAAEQAADELRAEGAMDGSSRTEVSEGVDSKKEQPATPLYSRLRFPFRRNQHAQSAVKPVLKYTHTAEGNELIGAAADKKSPKMSRSMSPSRPTWEDSASSLNVDSSPMIKPERQISNLSDSLHDVENEKEEPKGMFASIRSQWEQANAKKVAPVDPVPLGKPSISKLDDSTTDFQQVEHMTIPPSAEKRPRDEDATSKTLTSRDSRNDSTSPQKRPAKDPTAVPQRSNSARDLIQKMEAVTREKRDRKLGPPVTTATRGRMPRRNSESSNASAPVTATVGRGSMRSFRQSSFSYRNRGVASSPAKNDLQQTSTHSQPVNERVFSKAAASDSSYVGSVRSRAEAWRQRGSSVGAGSRRSMMSGRGRQSSQSSFASESLQGEPSNSQCAARHPPQRISSASSSTSSLNMTEPSLGVDPNAVPTSSPIPRNITTSNSSNSIQTFNHGTSNHSTSTFGFIIPTDDSLALKSVVRANRRRNLAETYTQTLESLIYDDPSVEEYIENFDLLDWKDDAILALAKYQETLGIQHEQFVLSGEISERDFWCRYFYRCDEKRILADMRKKQSLGILGQSSRNVLNAPVGNGGKAFARGPQLKQNKVVSGPAGFGSSFRRNEMRMSSNHSGSSFQSPASSSRRRNSVGAAGPARGNLKEKLANWSKVSGSPAVAPTETKAAEISSAAARAQRYRNRSASRPNPPASFRNS